METETMNCFLNKSKIADRNVIIWGAGKRGQQILVILERYNLEIECFVDSNAEAFAEKPVNHRKVNPFTYLSGQSDKYFVVVATDRFYPEIEDFLSEEGYTEVDDFFWYNRTAIIPELANGYYKDDFENEVNIESTSGMESLSIRIYGQKNDLKIRNAYCLGQVNIQLRNNARICVTDTLFFGECNINSDNGKVTLSDEMQLKDTRLNAVSNAIMTCKCTRLTDFCAEVFQNSKLLCETSDISGMIRATMKSRVELRSIRMSADAKVIVDRHANFIVLNSLFEKKFLLCVADKSICMLKHVVFGKKTSIHVEKNSSVSFTTLFLYENSRINCKDHSLLDFSECKFGGGYDVLSGSGSKVQIKKLTTYGNGQISCEYTCFIKIDVNCHFHKDFYMRANHESSITIGKNCGISKHVTMLSGDSHPIYHVDSPQRYSAKNKIEIGEKVWVGDGVVLLGNTVIGFGSIVSPRSVLGSNYPNNCMLMGYPARIIRQDIIWDRTETDPDKIQDKSYWKYTVHEK